MASNSHMRLGLGLGLGLGLFMPAAGLWASQLVNLPTGTFIAVRLRQLMGTFCLLGRYLDRFLELNPLISKNRDVLHCSVIVSACIHTNGDDSAIMLPSPA